MKCRTNIHLSLLVVTYISSIDVGNKLRFSSNISCEDLYVSMNKLIIYCIFVVQGSRKTRSTKFFLFILNTLLRDGNILVNVEIVAKTCFSYFPILNTNQRMYYNYITPQWPICFYLSFLCQFKMIVS